MSKFCAVPKFPSRNGWVLICVAIFTMSKSPSRAPHGAKCAKLVGKSIFFAGIQFAVGSVMMSSTFSVVNFAKDQHTLQAAADALMQFVIVATVWTAATMLVMYAEGAWVGAAIGFLANFVIVMWIVGLYIHSFRKAVKKYGLVFPTLSVFCW
jgi:hypothetical protein